MIRSASKALGRVLLVLLVALLLAPALIPPFLDRVYYTGPVSDHFDGQHFFNPDPDAGGITSGATPARMIGFLLRRGRAPWPDHVPVAPAKPAARLAGTALRITWIGHATTLVQTQGLNILTDPIWAERAGPFGLFGPKRVREPGVRFDDLPKIDLVVISHNHYDHMDLATLRRLWDRDRPLIVTSLGNDTILRGAGIQAVARDWGGRVTVRPGIDVIVERVHHWGSRWGKDRNRALWSGFTLTLPGGNLFFAGDTGLGDGGWVRDAGRDGPYRLAIIPIGAFEPRDLMQASHIGPAEAAGIFEVLGARSGLAVHWGTFQLSNEAIDEPRDLLATLLARDGVANGRFRAQEAGQGWDVP
jgi:L-ascorbate metabolism protein UlaG (beta-lactamase superfamily)